MFVNKKIKVTGKVQGVFYRASAKAIADELNIKGWIKNDHEGNVIIYISGKIENVLALISWCRTGPVLAQVEEVIVEDAGEEDIEGFEIRR